MTVVSPIIELIVSPKTNGTDVGRPASIYWGELIKIYLAGLDLTGIQLIQKCNMDRNCPDYYIEPSHEESLAATEALIEFIRSLPPPMDFFETATSPFTLDHTVQPILTPRFAISTSPELLTALGNLAKSDPTLHIQTHISENLNEVAFTKELFPNSKTYAGVYDDFGLLRNNTILAHAVHLEDAEMELIKDRNAGISHCPTSNFNLSSGVAKVGEYLDRGIKVNFIN